MKDDDFYLRVCFDIKQFREIRKLSHEDMSSQLGITTEEYRKIERAEIDVTLRQVISICELLEISLNELLKFESTNVFNYNSSNVQSHNDTSKMVIHNDDYLEKYVNILEEEVERLKKKAGED